MIWLYFANLIAPAVITTSIILSANKIQNGDILKIQVHTENGRYNGQKERDITDEDLITEH